MKRWSYLVAAVTASVTAAVVGAQLRAVQAQPVIENSEFKPTVETYIVEPGDTLWDISRKVVGSPWLWPRVWSYNPEIQNPNWIYPGDQIRFFPSEVELPSLYDLASAQRDIPDVEAPPPTAEAPRIEEVGVQRRTDPGFDASRFVGLFVTPKELAEAGTLTNAFMDKMLLSNGDEVALSFPQGQSPRSGERYLVYRTLGKVVHPVTGEKFGYMTQVTGLASIEEVLERTSRARLHEAMVEIERGQYVARYDADLRVRVRPVPAAAPVEGVVLAIQIDAGVVAGEHQTVFIDKGKGDGVQVGNRFSVIRRGDPLTRSDGQMPEMHVAQLIVMDTKETASTCLVTSSLVEIEPGLTVRAVTQ